eukprot:Pgem_evm2s9077
MVATNTLKVAGIDVGKKITDLEKKTIDYLQTQKKTDDSVLATAAPIKNIISADIISNYVSNGPTSTTNEKLTHTLSFGEDFDAILSASNTNFGFAYLNNYLIIENPTEIPYYSYLTNANVEIVN